MTRENKISLIRIVLTAVLMVLLLFIPMSDSLRAGLFLIPYLIAGYDVLLEAVKGIVHREVFDENFLMAVASVGAILLGDCTEATAVMLFYKIGELFEDYAVDKSRKNISDLIDIRPDYANMEENGSLIKVSPDSVAPGSTIVVQPGEKVPIDGIITEGNTSLDTVALTGESLPSDAGPGSEVLSGCINMTGQIRIRTTKEFGESTVAKILDLVQDSSERKARQENFITKFAHYYTPAVCFAALALALLPPLIRIALGLNPVWGDWIYRALTFLVISCPCALVISIPLGFFSGIGGASRCGILVKGSDYLEALSKTKTVVFDKTGTLTKGVFKVTEIYSVSGNDEELLHYAALAESSSSHPISLSLREAYGKEIDRTRVKDIKEISGHGVTSIVDGHAVAAGNRKLMDRLNIPCEDVRDSGTIVHVSVDNNYAGYILISDEIKPGAKEAVMQLKNSGVEKTVMLTGDRKDVAADVAENLSIDEVHAELLPSDKVEQVEKLLKETSESSDKRCLAFVGDGINDAPVLSRADIGIAMGALGSDAAIEAADVVLMDDDPAKVAKAIRISRKCLRIVYENIGLAIGVKSVCLLLGALGIASMWMAVFADVGVMVLAVLNAMRALHVKNI